MSTVDDPTTVVNSPSDAMTAAEKLLDAASAGRDRHYQVWATAAVEPLAATLYAASCPAPTKASAGWRRPRGLVTDATAPSWHSAIAELGDQPLLSNSLDRVLGWDTRQRDSIVIMRDALMPWMPPERWASSE